MHVGVVHVQMLWRPPNEIPLSNKGPWVAPWRPRMPLLRPVGARVLERVYTVLFSKRADPVQLTQKIKPSISAIYLPSFPLNR